MLVKHPRTYHLPWSPGRSSDDRVMADLEALQHRQVIVTVKMDGENTTLYRDHIHARSLDSSDHPSRSWVKNFWAGLRHDIPEGFRVCAENLYAKHSIAYDDLPSYVLAFSAWNGLECLDWDETLEWLELLGIEPVPVVYEGRFDIRAIQTVAGRDGRVVNGEGYVVRVRRSFHRDEFPRVVGKYVREGHVQTVRHWLRGQRVTPNKLRR